jgi:hypothetical protein
MGAEQYQGPDKPNPLLEEEIEFLRQGFRSLITSKGWGKVAEQGLLADFQGAPIHTNLYSFSRDLYCSRLEINSDLHSFVFSFNRMGEMKIGYTDKTKGRYKVLSTRGSTNLSYFEGIERSHSSTRDEIIKNEFSKFDERAVRFGTEFLREITEKLPSPE